MAATTHALVRGQVRDVEHCHHTSDIMSGVPWHRLAQAYSWLRSTVHHTWSRQRLLYCFTREQSPAGELFGALRSGSGAVLRHCALSNDISGQQRGSISRAATQNVSLNIWNHYIRSGPTTQHCWSASVAVCQKAQRAWVTMVWVQ